MIARLHGILVEASLSQEIVIDVNGVGYEVLLPNSSFSRLPRVGEELILLIHTVVREDAITLFGFLTKEEKELFKILINISGVGGKLANSILGSMSVESFCTAVQTKNSALLSKIPGIGKRTVGIFELGTTIELICSRQCTGLTLVIKHLHIYSPQTGEVDIDLCTQELLGKQGKVKTVRVEPCHITSLEIIGNLAGYLFENRAILHILVIYPMHGRSSLGYMHLGVHTLRVLNLASVGHYFDVTYFHYTVF